MIYTTTILLLLLFITNLLLTAFILNSYLKRVKETDRFFDELIKTLAKLQIKINEIYLREN